MSAEWAGRVVTSARAKWKPRLPLPCFQCGGPVLPEQAWVVEHIVPRSMGGSLTDPSNQWVSHRTCSDKSGGRMTAARQNANKTRIRQEDQRLRPW